MNIQEKLMPIWDKICTLSNVEDNIGTLMQKNLESDIRKELPHDIGYIFHWNMSGDYSHIFYEIENPNNKLVLK